MKSLVNKIAGKFNIEIRKIRRTDVLATDFEKVHSEIYQIVKDFTMTRAERIYSLIESVKYIEKYQIEGDIVECGVWKGGSMMTIAETLKRMSSQDRTLYLYDTFEGMPPPDEIDKDYAGNPASVSLAAEPDKEKNLYWAYSTLETVKKNMTSTGYPESKIKYVKGMVEETIPAEIPRKIAILRLDTDWYSSTVHELKFLFPLLSKGGILIIDDYGHWQGARKAVDEYFKANMTPIYLSRIDETARIAIKQ